MDFCKNIMQEVERGIVTPNVKIRDEKLQYEINRVTTKVFALSSDKIDKYDYMTGKEILPPQQHKIMQEAKFTYSLAVKAFEKQRKAIEKQGGKTSSGLTILGYDINNQQIQPYQLQTKLIGNILLKN